MRVASRHSRNVGLIRLVALWSFYPRIASLEYRANRNRKKAEVFCWDNKASQFAMGSVVAMRTRDDFNDRVFVFYHERMYLEANLTLFDATAVTAVETALCLRELALRPFNEVSPAFLTDEESKMAPAFPFALEREEEAKHLAVLFFDGDKKVYVTSLPVGLLLRDLRECMDYYLALAIKEVRADLFPEELIRALAYTIGYPINEETSLTVDESRDNPVATDTEEQKLVEPTMTFCGNTHLNDNSEDEGDAPEIVMEEFEDMQMTEEEIQRAIAVFGDLAILNRHSGSRLLGAFEKGEQQRGVEAELNKNLEENIIPTETEPKLEGSDGQNANEYDDDDEDIIVAKVGELDMDYEDW
ncbi:ATP-dependent DEAD/H RNA helicase [Trypanosoma conorhini]|uniref:ATP-dependent DEAD/H RNA helicase n=1 Tax=Trypanosoma conorhini TaxID=83891 RepID=A0A422Q2W1_9TRYP|nr:ATP-dependent DEAD/H RNA helicase [Trypanosoma conorhini]RNF24272.1 ATP-dependent DEAD/H RNA helicase [Trypanosoma conorhini]